MKSKIAYICGIDFQHELAETDAELFASVKQLKSNRKCWRECGIVKVEVKQVRWVVKQNLIKEKYRD